MVGVDDADVAVDRPVVEDTGNKESKEGDKDFLDWVKKKLDGLKGWFNGVIGSEKEGEN